MTREEAKKLLPVIKAFCEGKAIQKKVIVDKHLNTEWRDVVEDEVMFEDVEGVNECRIKPSSTYRPFKNAEECWQEMQKHQPFGWIQDKDCKDFKLCVLSVDDGGIMVADYANDIIRRTYDEVHFDSIFADGTPFGIKDNEE